MTVKATAPPVVLCFSALDPSGRGGIQADIETIASLGGHCAPVVTAACTTGVDETAETIAVDPTLVIEQARSVLEDMTVSAIKIGFTGSVAIAEAIHSILNDYPAIPVVLHPAFCLWDPNEADQADLPSALNALLLPATEIVITSREEAHTLVKEGDTLHATAQALMSHGCDHVLVKHNSPQNRQFQSTLYHPAGVLQTHSWLSNTPTSHGITSTLASAIAAFRAHDCPLPSSVEQAQNFALQTLNHARQLGFGKPTPNRLFWAESPESAGKKPSGTH